MYILKRKFIIIILIIVSIALFFPINTYASQNFVSENTVILSKGTTVDSDYFAAGGSVILDGTVVGDAYVAGGNVIINGLINGDVLTAGGNISINGRVTGNVRAIGGQIIINGQVDRNVTIAGGSISIQKPAVISGSLTTASGNLALLSPVGKNAVFAGNRATINSTIGGNVRAAVEQLDVMQDARIQGNLDYWSQNQAHVVPYTVQNGTFYHHVDLKTQKYERPNKEKLAGVAFSFGVFWVIVSLSASLLIGLILLHFVPVFMNDLRTTLTMRPWRSLGVGFLTVVLMPFAFFVLLISVIGIPFALLLAVVFILLVLMNQIFIAYVIGKKLLPQRHELALLSGLIVYAIISWIPVIGWMFNALALFIGFGAIIMVKKQLYITLRTKKLI